MTQPSVRYVLTDSEGDYNFLAQATFCECKPDGTPIASTLMDLRIRQASIPIPLARFLGLDVDDLAKPDRLPEKEAVMAIIERLAPVDGSVVCLIGYNVSSDIYKYQAAAKRHGLAFPPVYYWDVYHKGVRQSCRYSTVKDKSQQSIAEFLGIEVHNAHDSFDDVMVLSCIIQAAIKIPPLDSDRWQLKLPKDGTYHG